MGGFGSTRWNSTPTRRQADGSFRLSAPPAWMVAEGSGVYRFTKGFRVFCDIEQDGETARVRLRYPGGVLIQSAELVSTPANLRGARWWWLCPFCSRRCLKLYYPPRADRFACRVCHDLSYESAQASRCTYYELFKSSARRYWPDGPQAAYLRSIGLRPLTATYFREHLRAGTGSFTVGPYEGTPERLN